MKPSSVVDRPFTPTPSELEKPRRGVFGHVVRAGILATLLALAVGAGGRGASTPGEAETRLVPARQVAELPFQPFVAPAPAADDEPREQPAAQVGRSGIAPRQVAPQAPAGQAPTTGGGGDTNVVYDNGTNDTETSSGGSHVTNDSTLHSRAGVDTGQDDEPAEEDAEP